MNRYSSRNRVMPAVQQHKKPQNSLMYNFSLCHCNLRHFILIVTDIVTIK